MNTTNERADEILAHWAAMKTARQNFEILWDDCARYIMPRKGNILTKRTSGQDQSINLYDSTAEEAAGIFAAGFMTHIMPAGEKWYRLQPATRSAPDAVKEWLDRATDVTTDMIASSNFYLTAHEDCLDAGIFATSLYLLEEGKRKALNFVNIPVGTFAVEEDAEGMVDTVGREWQWTARQAAQKWGREKLGKNQLEALNSKTPSQSSRLFTYVQLVEPRKDSTYQGGPASAEKRPIRSCYVCVEDQQVIEEGGYYTMPYFCSRLLRSNNEVYGRGPGIQVMPEIKLVNAMERDMLTILELMARPPWLAPEDSSYTPDSRPDGVTYWDATSINNKPEQIQLKNRLDLAEQKTEQKRNRIRRAFYNDLFQLLTNEQTRQKIKTATEVQEMVAEKLLLFSPIFARYTTEKLTPMLERVLDIAIREGMIEPPPPEAQGMPYEVAYVSKIALAIKAAETRSFITMANLVTQLSQFDPSLLNVLNLREGVRETARSLGVSSKLIRSDREVDAMTAAQQRQQMAMQAAQTAELASRTAKNLGPQAQEQATEAMAAA